MLDKVVVPQVSLVVFVVPQVSLVVVVVVVVVSQVSLVAAGDFWSSGRARSLHISVVTCSRHLPMQVKHQDLRAQVLYRLEQYDQCYTVYKDLIKSTDDK